MADKLVTSFYDTTAHLHDNSGPGPGWWLPFELLLLSKLTARCAYECPPPGPATLP